MVSAKDPYQNLLDPQDLDLLDPDRKKYVDPGILV